MHTFSPYKQNAHATKQFYKRLCIFGPKGAIKIRYYYYYYYYYYYNSILPHPETVLFFVKVKVKVRTLAIVPLT